MSEPVNNNLVTRALGLLLPQYDNSPIIQALVKTYTQGLQEIRDDVFEVKTAFSLDGAEGEQLDYIAKGYDLVRELNESDEVLRHRVYNKLASVKANGTVTSIRQLTGAATGYSVRVVDAFPNAVHIIVEGQEQDKLAPISTTFLQDITPSGTEVICFSVPVSNNIWQPCKIGTLNDKAKLPSVGEFSPLKMATLVAFRG